MPEARWRRRAGGNPFRCAGHGTPLFTARCAVNRVSSWRAAGQPGPCLTVDQALHAITLGAAYSLKMDHEIGSIEVGKRADFAILDEDPYEVAPMN